MILLTIALLVLGLVILVYGADVMVRGASSISKKAGIPPIVVGLTIVAFGTSAPELIVNVFSALSGSTDLALGNIIGSNISNILLILGISALIVPLTVQRNTTWKEIPFALLAVVMLLVAGSDMLLDSASENVISSSDALGLLGFFVIFLYYTFEIFLNRDKNVSGTPKVEEEIKTYSYPISAGLTLLGLVMLFVGGRLLVDQAIVLATLAGMSEMLIGLTVVAIGTSLPELAASIIAARKGQTDIAIGNVVGSNIFNTLWILGITGLVRPIPISDGGYIDILVCIGATILLFIFLFLGRKNVFERWQGAAFVAMYVAYTAYVIWRG